MDQLTGSGIMMLGSARALWRRTLSFPDRHDWYRPLCYLNVWVQQHHFGPHEAERCARVYIAECVSF